MDRKNLNLPPLQKGFGDGTKGDVSVGIDATRETPQPHMSGQVQPLSSGMYSTGSLVPTVSVGVGNVQTPSAAPNYPLPGCVTGQNPVQMQSSNIGASMEADDDNNVSSCGFEISAPSSRDTKPAADQISGMFGLSASEPVTARRLSEQDTSLVHSRGLKRENENPIIEVLLKKKKEEEELIKQRSLIEEKAKEDEHNRQEAILQTAAESEMLQIQIQQQVLLQKKTEEEQRLHERQLQEEALLQQQVQADQKERQRQLDKEEERQRIIQQQAFLQQQMQSKEQERQRELHEQEQARIQLEQQALVQQQIQAQQDERERQLQEQAVLLKQRQHDQEQRKRVLEQNIIQQQMQQESFLQQHGHMQQQQMGFQEGAQIASNVLIQSAVNPQLASAQVSGIVKVVIYDTAGQSKQYVLDGQSGHQVADLCENADISTHSQSSGGSSAHHSSASQQFATLGVVHHQIATGPTHQGIGGFVERHSDNASNISAAHSVHSAQSAHSAHSVHSAHSAHSVHSAHSAGSAGSHCSFQSTGSTSHYFDTLRQQYLTEQKKQQLASIEDMERDLQIRKAELLQDEKLSGSFQSLSQYGEEHEKVKSLLAAKRSLSAIWIDSHNGSMGKKDRNGLQRHPSVRLKHFFSVIFRVIRVRSGKWKQDFIQD